ncbi:PHD finger protein 24-like [Littorina saxatilis]|uniref:EF-hand domain-containing protein n=1 Tax=Littorina saxatilis TaxID=31220 RepID=A0AAN9B7U1_9CAEN
MGNNNGGESSGVHQYMDDGIIADHLQRKIRVMGALSHDCRARVEERTHIRERLAEMKEERRRISVDLRGEICAAEAPNPHMIGSSSASGITRDTDKSAVAAYDSDKICAECGKEAKRDQNYPCRICTRIYHPACLKICGECRHADLKAATRALSNEGWSCFNCGNLSSLLTEDEIEQMIETFDKFDKDNDNLVSWEEYRMARVTDRRRMSEMEEMVTKLEFQMADQNGDQCLDWWEFLNLAAQHQLGKRSETELVDLLTEKEVIRAKSVFNELDKDRDGVVSGLEARRAIRKWCSSISKGLSPDAAAKMSTTIDSHVEVRARMLVDGGDEEKDTITWFDFLAQQALHILCSRPNMAPSLFDKLSHK